MGEDTRDDAEPGLPGTDDEQAPDSDRGMITGLGVVYLTVGFLLAVFLGIFGVAWFSLMP